MSLRRRLLEFKANREKWENRLAIAAAVCFAAAIAANVGAFFSPRGTPSPLGTACSWLYAVFWTPAAVFLRDRTRWVRTVLIVRWTAVGAILLGIAAGAGGGTGWFSALCVMPYAVFTSVYLGLSREAWLLYLLPLAQAAAASLLFRRLRRRQRAARRRDG